MKTDFHCHSTASDGTLSPDELVRRAAANGVEMLAITDHDTLAAYGALPDRPGLTLINGVELSCQWRRQGIHVVGLDVALDEATLSEGLDGQKRVRTGRAVEIAERLEQLGIDAPLEGARAFAGEGTIGRPHFARHLVASGRVRSEREAFRRFLGKGKAGDVRHCWPELETAVHWIRAAGGVAILAHPGKYRMTRTRLRALLAEFRDCGGQAMEVVSGRQTSDQTRTHAALCREFGLHASWGSDFHCPSQTWLDVGDFSLPPPDLSPVWELWQ